MEESVAPFCGRQDTVRSIQVVCATALHAPGRDKCLPVRWGLDVEQGVWRADPEKGLVLLRGGSLRMGVRSSVTECAQRKPRLPQK